MGTKPYRICGPERSPWFDIKQETGWVDSIQMWVDYIGKGVGGASFTVSSLRSESRGSPSRKFDYDMTDQDT